MLLRADVDSDYIWHVSKLAIAILPDNLLYGVGAGQSSRVVQLLV